MMSVEQVAKIADPMERLTAASDLARKAEAQEERLRSKRDLAILTMLRPFAEAVAPTNAVRAQIRRRLNDGEITEDEYEVLLRENREQRGRDLAAANPPVQPSDVYKMLDVSRNLVNRLLMRMPSGDLPPVLNPKRTAREAHAKMPACEALIEQAKEIRDTAALILMSGEDDDGRTFEPVSNADVARATGLTTARIAQLREGVR